MTRKTLCSLAAISALLACTVPARAGSAALNYATGRKVIRACILNPGVSTPSPYVFYLLDRSEVAVTIAYNGVSFVFYPPKPRGWEFENPLAQPGTPKSDPAYWDEPLVSMDIPRLGNYDLILLPVKGGGIALDATDQSRLAAWVDQGGLLWIDRQRDIGNPGQVALFPEPLLTFPATDETGPAGKLVSEASHALLRGRFILTGEEIEHLGRQLPYSSSPVGESGLDVIDAGVESAANGTGAPTALQRLLHARADLGAGDGVREYPVIAAGRIGQGTVVVTACGVAEGIQNWYQGMVGGAAPTDLELPEWSLPDFKLAYNMIQWAMDWSGQHGGPRHMGQVAGLLPGPLTMIWSHQSATALSGAPVVERGVAYVNQEGGTLSLLDVAPREGRAGGASDDGLADYAVGSSADEIGQVTVAGASLVGSPALITVNDRFPLAFADSPAPAGTPLPPGPRPIAVVAARATGGDESRLYAFPADPDVYALGTPASACWSAVINDGSTTQYGVAASGPVAVDGMVVVATSDSGTAQAPKRDTHLLVYDASAASAGETKTTPAAAVPLAQGGQAISVTSPPGVGYTQIWDEASQDWGVVQVALVVGNGLPRVATAATGQVRVVPLMVRVRATGWDHVWDTVEVEADGQTIPERENANAPLNYVRRVQGNYMEIIFTRFSLFRRGQYPTGGQPITVRYYDTSNSPRQANAEFQSGYNTFTRSSAAENGQSAPVTAGEMAFVVGEAIEGRTANSVHGQVAAIGLELERTFATEWVFEGDTTGGPDREDAANPRDYYTSFSFSPAVASDTLYVAGNYQFSQEGGSRQTEAMPAGQAGALYALNIKASPDLLSVSPSDPNTYDPATAVVSADPTLPFALDLEAPLGQGADPNQVVQADKRGVAVWITTRTDPGDADYNSPTYAIPQRSGMTVNWTVDFANAIIRLGPGAFGKYQARALRVRYFSGGAIPNGGDGVIVQADRLVNWAYHFATFDQATGDEVASARVISPPVAAADGTVHVMVRSNLEQAGTTFRRYMVSLRGNPAEAAASDRLIAPWGQPTAYWQPVGSPVDNEALLAGLAATADRVIAAVRGGTSSWVEGYANAATAVADNERVVQAQGAGQMAWEGLASREPDSSPAPGTVAADLPAYDSYADSVYRGFSRPSWARHLEGDNLLVCDTGHDRVVEVGPAGDVVWQYPTARLVRYKAGLATATPGSPIVTGDTDTNWTGIALPYDQIRLDADGPWHTVQSVDSDSQLTLTIPYAGAGGAAQPYTLVHREVTPEEQRLLGPLDAHRYRQLQAPIAGAEAGLTDPTGEMSWTYAVGTAAATTGLATVTGSGTAWLASVQPGDWFRLDGDGTWYVIASVDADDQITLTEAYADAGGSGPYTISVAVTIEWQSTLIADTGHGRVLEVRQPRLNGRYRPWVYGVITEFGTGEGFGQAQATNGSDVVTGSGALKSWLDYIRVGDYLRLDADGTWYRVASVGGYADDLDVVPDYELRLTRPYAEAGGTGDFTIQRRLYYTQYTQELVGPKTVWNLEEPEALGGPISPSYVERLGNPLTSWGRTHRLICAVVNNPADPSGRDAHLTLLDVALTYPTTREEYEAQGVTPQPEALLDPRVAAQSVALLHTDPATGLAGLNVFAPRPTVPRDFLRIRQAQQIPRALDDYNTLIVDDAGVKEINNATWASQGVLPVFEFTAADYLAEMGSLKTVLETSYPAPGPPYPPLIDETSDALRAEAYDDLYTYANDTVTRQAATGQVDFLPVSAWKNRAASAYWTDGGAYTIVNAYADPYQALGEEPMGARVKSEVFEVDPRLDLLAADRIGRRIVRWDFDSSKTGQNTVAGDPYGFGSWPHFIVPDPSRSVYPWIAGASYGLKQPQGVDRY